MNLSTLFFVFAFLPVSLILYLLCPRVCKNALLVLVSFLFYAWGSPVYLLLLLLVTVFNYCIGRDIGNRVESEQRGAKFVLVFGILFNLLLLGFYKYTAFAIETLNAFLPFTLNAPSPALPLGISFFTFTNLSYLSDVYHRRAPAQKNPLDFCLYVSFFPKMISGPIVEYAHIAPQLKEHPVTLDKVSDAVPMLVLGLAKKVLLADNLGTAFQSISALSSGSLSGGSAWLGAIFYSLQLYFDFSGYSDMAIGMAKLFGFDALLSWPDVRSRKPRVLGFHRKILLCGQLEAPFDWHSWLRPVDPNALSAARVLAARSRPCPFRIAAGRHFPALRSVYDERHLSILPLCPVLSEVIP